MLAQGQVVTWMTSCRIVVAIITTAGLHRRDDEAFTFVDLTYRVIPASTTTTELTMTHSSVHFDRSAAGTRRHDPAFE